jgi:C1A family cysteine protease
MMIVGTLRRINGWRRDAEDPRDWHAPPKPTMILPPRADLRSVCPPVGDQGPIGSCTANAGCEALEFLERNGRADRLFSRLFVYYCARQAEGTAAADDAGAQLRTTVKVLATIGAPYEASWSDDSPQTRFAFEPSIAAKNEANRHKALFYYRCPNLDTVKASLAQSYPVVFGFAVPDSMLSDRCVQDGIVLPPAPNEAWQGGHAVLAVGYDDNQPVGNEYGAILAQNSWGSDWGIKGYFWLPYSFFTNPDPQCSGSMLASDCWTLRRAQI